MKAQAIEKVLFVSMKKKIFCKKLLSFFLFSFFLSFFLACLLACLLQHHTQFLKLKQYLGKLVLFALSRQNCFWKEKFDVVSLKTKENAVSLKFQKILKKKQKKQQNSRFTKRQLSILRLILIITDALLWPLIHFMQTCCAQVLLIFAK